jgi:hypothetical protein
MANNTVEFIYQLADRVSIPLQNVREAFRKAHEQAKKVDSGIKKIPISIIDLRSEMTILERKKTFATTENEIKRVNAVIQTTQKELQRLENLPPKSFISRLREVPKALMGISLKDIGLMYATRMAARFAKESVKLYDIQAKAEAQVKSALEATEYAAGRTFSQLRKQASELKKTTLFGDQETLQAQSVLLTFKNVRGEIYDKAIPAIADLATHLKTDLKSATVQVGKALGDPISGITNLQRSGIQFTDEQKKGIKELVEAGKVQEAQMIIINELHSKFGGSAEAAAKAGLGPLQQLSNMWVDLREKLGGFILRNVNELVPSLRKTLEWSDRNSTSIKNMGKILTIGAIGFVSFKVATSGAAAGLKFFKAQALSANLAASLLTGGVKGLTAAWIALRNVQKATVIGAAFSIITTIGAALIAFRKRVNDVKNELGTVNKMAVEHAANEKVKIDDIFERLKRTNPQSAERNRLIRELKDMYPGLLDNMDLENGKLNDLEKAYNRIIDAVDRTAQARATEDRLVELYKKKGELEAELRTGSRSAKYIVRDQREVDKEIAALKRNRQKIRFEDEYSPAGVQLAIEKENLQYNLDNFTGRQSTYLDHEGVIKDFDTDWMDKRVDEIDKMLENYRRTDKPLIISDSNPNSNDTITGLTSGGSKATNVTITLRNLIEFLNLYPQNFKEGVEDVKDELTEGLLRVINSANRVGG